MQLRDIPANRAFMAPEPAENMAGWGVYVVGIENGPVKIGVARDLKRRLCGMQSGCPDELIIFHEERVPHSAYEVENLAHKTLKARQRRGEWFNVPAPEAVEVVQRCAATILAQRKAFEQKRIGLLQRLSAENVLEVNAVAAVRWYYAAMKDSGQDSALAAAFLRADRALQRDVGPVSLNLFRVSIVEGRQFDLEMDRLDDPRIAQNARRELAKAINALTRWWWRDQKRREGFPDAIPLHRTA